jgi:hypothetical protein
MPETSMSSAVGAAQNYRLCCRLPPAQPKPVIPNEAGRFFLPLSLLRKRRPAQRGTLFHRMRFRHAMNLSSPAPRRTASTPARSVRLFPKPFFNSVIFRAGLDGSRYKRELHRLTRAPRKLLCFNGLCRRKFPVDVRFLARRSGIQQAPLPRGHPARRAGNRGKLFRCELVHPHLPKPAPNFRANLSALAHRSFSTGSSASTVPDAGATRKGLLSAASSC